MKLELDLIDRVPYGYIVQYRKTIDSRSERIIIPKQIYNLYKSLPMSLCKKCRIKNFSNKYIKAIVSKQKKNNKYCMRIEFADGVLYIQDNMFNKPQKVYRFQNICHIVILDDVGRITSSKYSFFKSYDTSIKARYYIDKYADKFYNIYKKWHISNQVTYDRSNENYELFNGDIIYENRYAFLVTTKPDYIAMYEFCIISVEEG